MELLKVSYEQKTVLRNLMELYQYDMSKYEAESENDVNEYGLYDYKYLDHYWTEEGGILTLLYNQEAGRIYIGERNNNSKGFHSKLLHG